MRTTKMMASAHGVEHDMSGFEEVRIDAHNGGLVLVGPSAGELAGMHALLALPEVAPVQAIGSRLTNWDTAGAEVIQVGRSVSLAIRNGSTAVVHLDSHTGTAPPIAANAREFVCARLGQIMVGIADVPAFVVVHSELMARSLIIDSLGGDDTAVGRAADYSVWCLSRRTMFPGVGVALCPADRPANAMTELLAWFEARRS